jgi:hypothetical protein
MADPAVDGLWAGAALAAAEMTLEPAASANPITSEATRLEIGAPHPEPARPAFVPDRGLMATFPKQYATGELRATLVSLNVDWTLAAIELGRVAALDPSTAYGRLEKGPQQPEPPFVSDP